MGQTGIGKNLARLPVIILMNQNPARQDAEGAFDNAHVLIQHEMMDIRAIEQRPHCRNQHYVVGTNQFPQLRLSFVAQLAAARASHPDSALAAIPRSFYCYTQG